MMEIIFLLLATHLRFYVGMLEQSVSFKYDSSKVKINQIVITIY
jgi:hypothetical protein